MKKIEDLKKQGTIILLAAHEPELIHALADRVYSIHGCKISPYENVPQTTYVIWMSADTSLTSAPEMKKTEHGYYLISDERMLSHEINRLQKEGWHIGKVYEDDKHDEI